MNIVLFGAPGAGKGTQSSLLINQLGMIQISTGDLLRAEISKKTELGITAKSFMDKGQLVPDQIILGMVENVLINANVHFILDGFPRNVAQAEALQEILTKLNKFIGKAIFLEVPSSVLLGRLCGRRVCRGCNEVFHVDSKPSNVEGICDRCGGELYQRSDDNEVVISERFNAYNCHTMPLKEYYKQAGLLEIVDGNRNTEEVFKDIRRLLN